MKFISYEPEKGEKYFRIIAVSVKNYLNELQLLKIHYRDGLLPAVSAPRERQTIAWDIYKTMRHMNGIIVTLMRTNPEGFDAWEYELYEWAKQIHDQVSEQINR